MESQNQNQNFVSLESQISSLDNQLANLDQQKNFLMAQKLGLEKEKQKLFPNAFEAMKNANKRKRDEICDDPDFITLQKSLRKKFKDNNAEEDTKGSRRTYTEEEKKIVIKLANKFPKSEVAQKTSISVNNIKKFLKNRRRRLSPREKRKEGNVPSARRKNQILDS